MVLQTGTAKKSEERSGCRASSEDRLDTRMPAGPHAELIKEGGDYERKD